MGKVRDWTGVTAAEKASQQAADAQTSAIDKSIGFQREALDRMEARLDPYEGLGQQGISQAGFLTDPAQQAAFLENNPMFQAALDNTNKAISKSQAASGIFNSGGTLEALKSNYFAQGLPLIDRQTQNINNLLSTGQNAAAMTGNAGLNVANNISGLTTDAGAVRSADIVNRGNLRSQAKQDLLSNYVQGGLLGAATGGATNGAMQSMMGGMSGAGAAAGGASTGGMAGMMSALGPIAAVLCDEEAKENKKFIKNDTDGLPVYEFNYIGSSQKLRGKMAQDIKKIDPEAVHLDGDGYYYVSSKYAPQAI